MKIVVEVTKSVWGLAKVSVNWESKLYQCLHGTVWFGWSNAIGFDSSVGSQG